MPRPSLHSLPRLTLTTLSLLLIALTALSTRLEFSYAHTHARFSIQAGQFRTIVRDKPMTSLPELYRIAGRSQWEISKIDFALHWKLEFPNRGRERHYYFPLWIPAALTSIPAVLLWYCHIRRRRTAHVAAHQPCPTCGYSRVGIPPEAPCPECSGDSRYSKLERAADTFAARANARFQRTRLARALHSLHPRRERVLRWCATAVATLLLICTIGSTFVAFNYMRGPVIVRANGSRLVLGVNHEENTVPYLFVGVHSSPFRPWPTLANDAAASTLAIPFWMPLLPTTALAAAAWLARQGSLSPSRL